jgi:hypothetical protein
MLSGPENRRIGAVPVVSLIEFPFELLWHIS